MIQPQTLKGFRDFLPEEAMKRQYVVDIVRKTFELYGFEPLETPALEYEEILLGKYGEEGDKLMYRFEDLGKRRVALRYDQTVPLARVISQYQNELPFPFKRYQIQPVWRAENPQKGRYREFLQCDADIIGSPSPLADAEVLALAYEVYTKLGLDVVIKINDRALLKQIEMKALNVLDKLHKIGEEGVLKELQKKGFSLEYSKDLLKQSRSFEVSLYLQKVLGHYEEMGFKPNTLKFDGTLVRGLDYYTGLIFEVVLKSDPNSTSLCGGGRYDNLIGMFANKSIPAVGFAIGFDRTYEAIESYDLFPKELKITKILITTFPGYVGQSNNLTSILRKQGINSEVYLELDEEGNPPKLDKQLKYADKKGIPYVAILGPEEVKGGQITLKNLKTETQQTLNINNLPDVLHHP